MKPFRRKSHVKCLSAILLPFCLLALNSFARCQHKFAAPKYKIRQQILRQKIGDTDVEILIGKTSERFSRVVYFNMHDNENTAAEAAKEIVEKYGGTLLELQNDGERLVNFSLREKRFTFDPNRIFTRAGIVKTLKFNGVYTAEAEKETSEFAEKILGLFKNIKLIIAVHNNTDENYSIESYRSGGEFEKDAKLVNVNAEMDADDFFYVTKINIFKRLKEKNQNVALQNNAAVADDGSLAFYCGRHKIPYINVESQHEHLSEQIKMLSLLPNLTKAWISPKK